MARPMHPFHRTELLVGATGYDQLSEARVAVIGLGGVGGQAAEALVRSGVGHVTMVDFDKVCVTNVNRQIHATRKTVGKRKSELMAERAKHINPRCDVRALAMFYESKTSDEILGEGFDVVLDCIDNMTAKLHLLKACVARDIPVISAMGAGGRMNPLLVRVTDISKTDVDPFARIVRDQLRQAGIHDGITAVWTEESPNDLDQVAQSNFRCICSGQDENDKHTCESRMQIQGSVAWMPAIFGLTMSASAVHMILDRPMEESKRRHHRQRPAPKLSRARKKELMAKAQGAHS